MRLVDADDFKKFLEALCKAGAPYHEVVELLDKQPTAFDIQKVCQQLFMESEDVRGDSMIELYAAQEIVERRGIE